MRLALVLSLSVLARDVAALAVGGPARPVARPAVARSAAATMGLVRQVNTAEFEEEIQDCSTPIVVDIFAVWCGPCRVLRRVVWAAWSVPCGVGRVVCSVLCVVRAEKVVFVFRKIYPNIIFVL